MSVSSIGSGSNSISDLLNQRRQSLQAMEASVQSGDLASAQQSLASVQSDTSSLQSTSSSTSQAVNPYRSTLATDLTSLSSALQSGQTTQAQTALAKLQSDLGAGGTATQGATTQGTKGAHHGHHHGGGGGSAAESTSQQAADALFGSSSDTTSASIGGTDPTSASGDVLSQLLSALDSGSQT